MPELDDHELLAEFARTESEAAFAALAARYVNLVNSAALRFAGNPHHAEEITQAVFIILARKAGKLSPSAVLSGWLYQTTRLTAANFMKGEIRRQHREQEAYMQSILTEPDAAAWQQLAPHLDEAMGRLGETDRDAIVLRFFENKTAREVGAALKLTEAAAHKRVNRALEKLRKIFSKRGVTLSGAIIAGAVSANSVHAAPVALAKTISAVAITKGAVASASTLTLVKGALKIMVWTKAKTAIGAGAIVLLVAGTTAVTVDKLLPVKVDDEWFVTDSKVLLKVPGNLTIIRPTHFGKRGGGGELSEQSRIVGYNMPLDWFVVYAENFSDGSRLVLPKNFPKGGFDVLITRPRNRNYNWQDELRQAMRDEIKRQFGFVARRETQERDMFLLKVRNPGAAGLQKIVQDDPNY
jgi:RNA polymerase sigma factor (sigma-70 family)